LASRKPPQELALGALTLDLVANRAFKNGEDLLLTQKEFALLFLLAQNEGEILTADFLYEKVWGRPMVGDKNTLRATISKLRKKLTPTGFDVCVWRGQGYVLEKNCFPTRED
jgi:DNA-binding response OmpR family regulator